MKENKQLINRCLKAGLKNGRAATKRGGYLSKAEKKTTTALEIIKKALIEYEKNHYESEGEVWQNRINSLIADIESGEEDF